MNLDSRDRAYLDRSLVLFEPDARVPLLVKSVRDIYEHRSLLKLLPYSDHAFSHLAKLIREAVETGGRFRTFDCLKVLRATLSGYSDEHTLPPEAIDDIIVVYQSLILSSREEVQWCLSRLLRGQILPRSAVEWLIDNWWRSEHVTNRLLRYPCRELPIVEWASARYRAGDLSERMSEVVALLIADRIPAFVKKESVEVIAWAVYYSRTSPDEQVRLLKPLLNKLPPRTIVDLARRLNAPELIHHRLAARR